MFVKTLVFSQTILQPNFAMKSHETLEILKVEVSSEKTLVYLTIENRIEKGSFCADRNIYITDPSGSVIKLISSSGIPVCPEVHNFKAPGEKLDFILTFPPLNPTTACIDLKEDCSESCFSFYGIILDHQLNRDLDQAFNLAESGQSVKALDKFISIASGDIKKGSEAVLYYNIIKLASETGNTLKAVEFYKALESSQIASKTKYIGDLNSRGIRY
jgi:hypothetical protein